MKSLCGTNCKFMEIIRDNIETDSASILSTVTSSEEENDFRFRLQRMKAKEAQGTDLSIFGPMDGPITKLERYGVGKFTADVV